MDLSSEQINLDVADTAPLIRREIADLMPAVPEWSLEDDHLVLRIVCKEFCDAVSLLNEISRISVRGGHLPDISIHKERVVCISWYTYAIGGLSRNDFIMAARISEWLWCRRGGTL